MNYEYFLSSVTPDPINARNCATALESISKIYPQLIIDMETAQSKRIKVPLQILLPFHTVNSKDFKSIQNFRYYIKSLK